MSEKKMNTLLKLFQNVSPFGNLSETESFHVIYALRKVRIKKRWLGPLPKYMSNSENYNEGWGKVS